jgi:hypothetical protein
MGCGIYGIHPTVDHCIRGLKAAITLEHVRGLKHAETRALRRRRTQALFVRDEPAGTLLRKKPGRRQLPYREIRSQVNKRMLWIRRAAAQVARMERRLRRL